MSEGSRRPPASRAGAETEDGPSEVELSLRNPNRYPEVAARRLGPWLRGLVGALAPEADTLSILFTSDREMRRLNRTWRDRDRPTDVLSFPGEETPEGRHLGDVAIAVPTARRQAAAAGHSVERELRVLTLHGVLHCLGHDHETDDGTMERLEKRLRRKWIDTPVDEEAPRDR